MAEKIPRITPLSVEAMMEVSLQATFSNEAQLNAYLDAQRLAEGVASGKLVVIPRQEIAKFFDAYRNSVVTPQMIAGAHSEADRLVFDTLAGWLDENSAGTNQGATKENR